LSNTGVTVIVYALAPSVKTMSPTMVVVPPPPGASPQTTFVVLETANVAISVSLLGMVDGVQFSAVFQSLLVGLRFQVALPAWSAWMPATRARAAMILLIAAFTFLTSGS
jgi:hypothetical protein